MNKKKVEFFRHNIGKPEITQVSKVLHSLFLTTGEYVDSFEKNLASYTRTKYAVGLTSCTGALHLALLAAGVKQGDEVITTPMSFVATANAICMTGAIPVFIDVEKETGNINANLIEKAITKKTKAIMPVHLYGQMVDMKKVLTIAKKYNVPVIEDAAHALESEREGIRPGEKSFGACFSFYATKSITSGEGGAFNTNSQETATFMKKLRSHGITSELAQRMRTGLRTYDIDVFGWKYNMDNIQAALLLPQLKKAESVWKKRDAIAKKYQEAFADLPLAMPKDLKNAKHGRHMFVIWVDPQKRDAILDYLIKHGVAAVINYPAIHLFTYYQKTFGYKEGMFPNAEEIANRTITLPLYAKLTKDEVRYIIDTVKRAVSYNVN